MGMKYSTQGGGAATGLGNDFATFLQQGLNTGSFGGASAAGQAGAANPAGSTQGIAGVLNDILSGGAGKLGGSMAQMMQTQQQNDVNGIRARFGASGGTAFGTPGQYAESTYRAQAAPQITSAIGNMQMSALAQLFPQIGALAQKGIPQAEVTAQQNPWVTAAGIAAPAFGAILGGPAGASLGGMFSGMMGGGGGASASGASAPFNMMPQNMDFSHMFQPNMSFNPAMSIPSGGGFNWGQYTPTLRF